MISQLGEIALYSALCFAILQSILPIYGYYRQNPYLLACARPAALGQSLSLLSAYLLLTYAFASNDFSLSYVALNSHPSLPLMYRLTAVWGGHEGSILLWVLLISLWSMVFAVVSNRFVEPNKKENQAFNALTIAILGILNSCFLCFLILTSDPFSVATTMTMGFDLNPLLQDPGFVIHPPMLYIGYVGFSVTFALTQAALIQNRLDQRWIVLTKKFAIAAWCFLTLGITLGSWWAYRVLGWGGFWFWDPVENASLLPWLTGTALIHILVLVEKRNIATTWAILLANVTCILSLLGTFLVRSGVLISAHTFANDPARGVFLLFLFALVSTLAILLFFLRNKNSQSIRPFRLHFFTRETSLILNGALLLLAMLTILLGTLYPLITDALHLGTISVGAPYFNKVMTPLVFILMLVMGIGGLSEWQTHKQFSFLKLVLMRALISVSLSITIILLLNHELSFAPILTLALSIWIILSVSKGWKLWQSMRLAHIGFALMVIGVMLSSLLQQEREVRIKPGDRVHLAAYHFLFLDTSSILGPNYRGIRAAFDVIKHGRHITNLYPEKRIYTVRGMVMTTVDIHPGIFRDLYIALGEPLTQNEWSVRIYYKPFIRFIWAGGILMILGGLAALSNHRREQLCVRQ